MIGLAFSPRAFLPLARSSLSCSSVCVSSSASSGVDQEGARPKPWLLVGLGNPGKLYDGTRHNVGFEMVDYIAHAEGISISNIRSKALFGKGQIGNVPVMFAKPQTFMNGSGESVASLVAYFKVPLNQVLLGVKDFPRLRIGIGRPPGKMDPVNFVLKPFSKKELEELSLMYQIGLEAVRILVRDGFDKSATFVNSGKSTKLLS
ncbi:unnamed protein product [Spirodela intermedia]|uniref:peptidyl-tRNA hydrolase n=1 Tax=Spirodela intermedia TaxID=51605 RepID=A0A7I8ITY4_SPIIN|nr:unnamed protein product [Spirodela intermedia]CAA6661276.1 unnamed protein product [Spirodela intermedia]